MFRIFDLIEHAGFEDLGPLIRTCRMYDALSLVMGTDPLNASAIKFLEDNASNYQLYHEYLRSVQSVISSYNSHGLYHHEYNPDDILCAREIPAFNRKGYLLEPDIRPYLMSSSSSHASSSHNEIRSVGLNRTRNSLSSSFSNGRLSSLESRPSIGSRSISSRRSDSEDSSVAPIRHVTFASSTAGGTSSFYSGFMNLGNTCYINSVLQILFHTGPFKKAILEYQIPSELRLLAQYMASIIGTNTNFGRISDNPSEHNNVRLSPLMFANGLIQLQLLFKVMSDPSRTREAADPSAFIQAFELKPHVQEQAHEFWEVVIMKYLRFLQIAEPALYSNGVKTAQRYGFLYAPICHGVSSFEDAIQGQLSLEKLCGLTMPSTFLVHVERSAQIVRGGHVIDRKRTDPFSYPDSFDASIIYENAESVQFLLRSFMVHDGYSLDRGHYRTYVFNVDSSEWIELNDSRSRKVDPNSNEFKKDRAQATLIQYINTNHSHYESFVSHDKSLSG